MAVKVAKIFQSGMVLQREMPVKVWGYGKPDERIKISIQGKYAETLVEADGRWSLELPPLAESSRETVHGIHSMNLFCSKRPRWMKSWTFSVVIKRWDR